MAIGMPSPSRVVPPSCATSAAVARSLASMSTPASA
ncbi:uncharacterized protein METZ01_LOCUS3181 [marine metagenome]|uniref:Uncharacterized protein n=1 Tax=marine metagenome TaxID=408172 RepID=A0A381N768_9ZZZZ